MKRAFGLVGLAGALWLVGCNNPSGPGPQGSATPAVGLKAELAVVEAEKLLREHPDYPKLNELEERIQKLAIEEETLPLKGREKAVGKGQRTMLKALEQAKAEMEGEQARLRGEMEGLARALQGRMAAEMNEVKARLDADLIAKLKKIQPQDTSPDAGFESVGEYGENLKLMASRNLAARRLELEKATQNELMAERSRLDQQLAAHDDEVSLRFQEEKLNLQLKMQNNPSEEVEKATRARLDAIDDEVSAAKEQKRREIDAQMEAFRAERQAKFDREIAAYESRVKAEISEKIREKQVAIGKRPAAAPTPKEVQALIDQARSKMESEMAARKSELEAQMRQKEGEARSQLEAKSKQIEARLRELEKTIKAELTRRSDFLDKATQAKLDQVKRDLEKVRAERKQLYEKMLADLSEMVGKVAQKKNVPGVIGQSLVNIDLEDLTDLSMVEVKQMESR